MARKKLKTPYAELLPPLSTDEYAALKADIKANGGVRDPVLIDEEGNILDGRNRYCIDPNAPTRVVSGLSPAEKEAFVFRANFVRRNLSSAQKKDAHKRMKVTAEKLREENAKKWTQAKVATELGVARPTVETWLMHNDKDVKTHTAKKPPPPKPDARITLGADAKADVVKRVKTGESQAQVAADYGVAQSTVSRAVKGASLGWADADEFQLLADRLIQYLTSVNPENGD